jgi:tRNA-uridine 2-sulfurtransferase
MKQVVNQRHTKCVYIGLSGGVDSSVSAALLKEQGYDVRGVFIKGWYPPSLSCTWAEDRRDAMRVAARLQIPFETLDASKEYKESVIDYLVTEYKEGRTPNPDIMCNRDVKFGAFYRFAKNADYIATGHYALSKEGRLYRGKDESKDQSYFLWSVSKDAIAKTLFPLGELQKSEVRELAKRFMLPTAKKKDSQGICFLGPVSIEDFLRSEIAVEKGKAVTKEGKEVGLHGGALLSTLGERVSLVGNEPGPWYVIKKDLRTNVLTVSHEREAVVPTINVKLTASNWIRKPLPGTLYSAQYRYHGPQIEGSLNEGLNLFTPTKPLAEPLAPGQSLVIYEDDECLGGGIIAE